MSAIRATAIVLAALAVAACGGEADDTAPTATEPALTRVVEERLAVEAELRERIEVLEAALDGAPGGVDSLERRLGALEDGLRVLDNRVSAEQIDRIALGTRLEEAERDLRASTADVRDTLEHLRGQIQDLEIRYQVLQERIDRLQS
jgi:chromosome segregation ATPase